MQVQQILKSKGTEGVFTVTPDTRIEDAAKILAERRIGSLVVSTDGDIAEGIISERDIVRELATRGGGCLSDPVKTYMTQQVVTCRLADQADAILAQMTDGRFRHMPVVEGGKLVGLVTLGDVVKARLSELAMEKDALQGMIMGH